MPIPNLPGQRLCDRMNRSRTRVAKVIIALDHGLDELEHGQLEKRGHFPQRQNFSLLPETAWKIGVSFPLPCPFPSFSMCSHSYRLTGLSRRPELNGALVTTRHAPSTHGVGADKLMVYLSVPFSGAFAVFVNPQRLQLAHLEPLFPCMEIFDADAASIVAAHCDWHTLNKLTRVSHPWRHAASRQLRAWKGPRASLTNVASADFHIVSVIMTLFPHCGWYLRDDHADHNVDQAPDMQKSLREFSRAHREGSSFDASKLCSMFPNYLFRTYLDRVFQPPLSMDCMWKHAFKDRHGHEIDQTFESTVMLVVNSPASDENGE